MSEMRRRVCVLVLRAPNLHGCMCISLYLVMHCLCLCMCVVCVCVLQRLEGIPVGYERVKGFGGVKAGMSDLFTKQKQTLLQCECLHKCISVCVFA